MFLAEPLSIIAKFRDEEAVSETRSPARFPTTLWSRVIRAGDPTDREGLAALELLCKDYWYPLYAFVRRKGLDQDEASDLVQGLLADLIERRDFAKADPARGRFRSFLRTACEHFLANQREHDRAVKRGGGKPLVSIDTQDAEGRYVHEPSHDLTPERLFERRWAMVLLERVLAQLETEVSRAGKSSLFQRLRPALEGRRFARFLPRDRRDAPNERVSSQECRSPIPRSVPANPSRASGADGGRRRRSRRRNRRPLAGPVMSLGPLGIF